MVIFISRFFYKIWRIITAPKRFLDYIIDWFVSKI